MADTQGTGSQPQNKGGGYRGGPKRWTGSGPRPARHIPWPEIFKHHISLIEGHQKMIDMVRKHTVEGTGNHRQICAMIDTCRTLMHDTKTVSRNFVDLPNTRDQVPLGSSSASMYPGYSPADHVYGQAAMEYGSAAAKARAAGIELKPHADLEYEIGQGKGHKRKKLAEMPLPKGSQDSSGSASGSGADAPSALTNGKKQESETAEAKDEEMGDAAQPSFYIDTNPTPVDLPFSEKNDSKRVIPVSEPFKWNKPKKSKKAHDGELPAAPAQGKIETEDISAEVDARMKEKEEKRLRKEEKKRKKEAAAAAGTEEPYTGIVGAVDDNKKRKRESAGSSTAVAAAADAEATVNGGEELKKPKKKKSKKEKDVESGAKAGEDEPQPSSEPVPKSSEEANGKKKKKAKKDKEQDVKIGEDIQPAETESKKRSKDEAGEGDGEGKKKRKKRKLEEGAAE